MSIARPYIRFNTQQFVTHETSTKPYVGFEHLTDLPNGWQYDVRRWASAFDLKLPSLPRLSDSSVQGVQESEYFLSGVGSTDLGDLYVNKLEELIANYEKHWIPFVENGFYYRHRTGYFYYGDDSRVQYVDPLENRGGRNYLELDAEHNIETPILAATFKRHPINKTPLYHKEISYRDAFTGIYVDGEEQETVSELGEIVWANVDMTKKEFIVDQTIEGKISLVFNRDFTDSVGFEPQNYDELGACEFIGTSTGAPWQVFRLEKFPVLEDSFELYMADSVSQTYETLTRIDSWWDLVTTDYTPGSSIKYFLDKDLGIVYFGSNSSGDLGLGGGIPPIGRIFVAKYDTTLRIEYEEAGRPQHTHALDADVSPVTQGINQGFVCITHEVIEASSITLAINKPAIQGQIDPKHYGPVSAGADYALLTASVNSTTGLPVNGVEVTFEMSPTDIGYLDGDSSAYSLTNASGDAYSAYQPPASADSLGYYSTIVRATTNPSVYPDCKEVIIRQREVGLEGLEEDIYLYHILKDDILLGYQTLDDFLATIEKPSWAGAVGSDTYNRWKAEMVLEYDLKEWVDPATQPEGAPISGRKVVAYRTVFDPDDPSNDVENEDSDAIHPSPGGLDPEPIAIVPLRPLLVEQIDDAGDPYDGYWRLIYPEGAIPDIGPGANDVGGYWVVASKLIEFRAKCFSPYYNRDIYSNKIIARITLPEYLLGEYINDLGKKVPFGWKILGDDDNVAAGLNGATFITVNPHSGPYNILDLVGESTGPTEDWASAPFKSVGVQFDVIPSKDIGFQFKIV